MTNLKQDKEADFRDDIAKVDARPARTVFVMMTIMVVGKAMGLLRDSMQALHFGADTPYSVAFVNASALPRNFLDIMFAAALSASFIPVFTARIETKGKREAFDLASLFISVSLVLLGVVTVIAVVFAGPLHDFVYIILPGRLSGDGVCRVMDASTRNMGVELLRFMLPLMFLSGLAFSFTGILQSLGEFRLPAAMSVVSNGVILVYYFFMVDRFGVRGLAVAFLIGWAMQAVIQVPWLVKHKFKFRFRINLKDSGLREIGALTLPVLAASWMLPVNFQVNLMAVGSLYGGVIGGPALQFAYNLYTIVSGVFILSVANILFPKLSRQVATKDEDGFKNSLGETVRVLFFFLLPLTLGLMALSQPLVQLVFGRGMFDAVAVEIASTALFFFSIGIVGYGFQVILCRACFARKDGKTPLIAAIGAIGVNAILSFALLRLEIAGPALASAIGISLGSGIMLVILTKKGYLAWPKDLILDILKMAALAAWMFVAVRFTLGILNESPVLLQVAVPGLIGAIIYIGGCMLFRMKELNFIIKMFRR
ncbi:MAG: murein biosynthesis integral membrane protein MurJ [Defluviitaleaceae bacterium]|nr:murein biosynthesis integral membrane protein MurJ [Defluviitaleaceae bacterium]